jgi:hypothetical protein
MFLFTGSRHWLHEWGAEDWLITKKRKCQPITIMRNCRHQEKRIFNWSCSWETWSNAQSFAEWICTKDIDVRMAMSFESEYPFFVLSEPAFHYDTERWIGDVQANDEDEDKKRMSYVPIKFLPFRVISASKSEIMQTAVLTDRWWSAYAELSVTESEISTQIGGICDRWRKLEQSDWNFVLSKRIHVSGLQRPNG